MKYRIHVIQIDIRVLMLTTISSERGSILWHYAVVD